MASEEKNQNNIISSELIMNNIKYIFADKPINRFKTKPKVEDVSIKLKELRDEIEKIEKIIEENKNKYECFIANDNSNGQLVVSGNNNEIEKFILDLKSNSIKNIKLSVSAPFHCKLMKKATDIMTKEITKLEFKDPKNILISNVTGKEVTSSSLLKDLLIKQIESRVRWRESVMLMINKGISKFIEIGPGKVLSGLIKRIDKNVKVSAINNEEDIKLININD